MERWWPTSWRNVNWVSTATVLEDPFLALSRNDIVALTCILRVTRHILQKKEGGWGGRKEVVLVKQALIQLGILCKSFPSVLELFQQISQYAFENNTLCQCSPHEDHRVILASWFHFKSTTFGQDIMFAFQVSVDQYSWLPSEEVQPTNFYLQLTQKMSSYQ